MPATVFAPGFLALQRNEINYLTDTIVAMCLTAGYTYNSTDAFVSSVVAQEVTGTARQTITNPTITNSGTAIIFSHDNAVFPTPTTGQTIVTVVYYKANTNDANHALLWLLDPADLVTDGENVTLRPDSTNGILSLPYA